MDMHSVFKTFQRCYRSAYFLPCALCRHPDPSQRPRFSEIYSLLHTQGEELLVSMEHEVEVTTPTASGSETSQWQLGSTLEGDTVKGMFQDLQTLYRDSQS